METNNQSRTSRNGYVGSFHLHKVKSGDDMVESGPWQSIYHGLFKPAIQNIWCDPAVIQYKPQSLWDSLMKPCLLHITCLSLRWFCSQPELPSTVSCAPHTSSILVLHCSFAFSIRASPVIPSSDACRNLEPSTECGYETNLRISVDTSVTL